MRNTSNTHSALASQTHQSQRVRQRGGQPGNLNALKHGFHARHFTQREASDLDEVSADDLNGEINLLRVMIRRTFQTWAATSDVADQVALFDAISKGLVRLGTLLKTRHYLNGGQGQLASDLDQALTEVLAEMRSEENSSARLNEEERAAPRRETGRPPASGPAARPNSQTGTPSTGGPAAPPADASGPAGPPADSSGQSGGLATQT